MITKNHNVLILILAIGTFSILNTEVGIIGILPLIAEKFSVDITQAGLLVSLFALIIAGAGIIMPLLFSGFNRKKVMIAVLTIFSVCNLIAAFALNFAVVFSQTDTGIFSSDILFISFCSGRFLSGQKECASGNIKSNDGRIGRNCNRHTRNELYCKYFFISDSNAVFHFNEYYRTGLDTNHDTVHAC